MESTMTFLAWCVFAILLSASRTGGNVISRPADRAAAVGDGGLVTRLLGAVRLTVASDNSSVDARPAVVLAGAGRGDPGQRGGRRSAPGDSNLSDSPAALALAEDLSGAELAEILRGLLGDSAASAGAVPVSLRCSGQPVAAGSHQASYAEYASDTCNVIPAVDNAKVNTRGLCPWTYVEHTDPDRYPSTMLYAQCACPDCVRQSVSPDYGCHPIYNDVKVLRKHACQDGIQIYESVYESVPVACACLRALQ